MWNLLRFVASSVRTLRLSVVTASALFDKGVGVTKRSTPSGARNHGPAESLASHDAHTPRRNESDGASVMSGRQQ